MEFSYRNGDFETATVVDVDPAVSRVEGGDLVWDLRLERGREWQCELNVRCGPKRLLPTRRDFGEVFDSDADDPDSRWREAAPTLQADSELLRDAFEKSIRDLVCLRIEKLIGGEPVILPAAGLPWFLTIFGRDSLITAYQTLSSGPHLARGALLSLGSHQGSEMNDFRDEEPGKILHEVRSGELTVLGLKPHNPYYGTSDATQLWLILLSKYWRWTGDDEFVRGLRDNAYAALRWIDDYGDLDGDGYVEYATRSATVSTATSGSRIGAGTTPSASTGTSAGSTR